MFQGISLHESGTDVANFKVITKLDTAEYSG
jgi:hypothetical protein